MEGNLTAADTLMSGKAAAADDIEAWRRSLIEELRPRAAEDAAFRRYLEDLARASPSALREWAVDTVAEFIAVRAG